MIKRLKRRFIFVNMSILTCVLIGILVSIFTLMYSSEIRLSNEIMESLLSQKDMDHNKNDKDMISGNNYDISNISLMNNDFNEDHDMMFPQYPNEWNNWYGDHAYNEREPMPPDNPYDRDEFYPPEGPPEDTPTDKPDEPVMTQNINDKPKETTALPSSPVQTEKNSVNSTPDNKTNNNINNDRQADKNLPKDNINTTPSEKNKQTTAAKENITNINSVTETTIPQPNKKPEIEPERKMEPDPFRGKVKRSYIYAEFKDINDIESTIYQFYTSEDNEDIESAVKQIFNKKESKGKISIGNNKYRYMYRYNPMKSSYSIVMLDRTLEINTINRLLVVFVIIASAGLIMIFLISIFLANWTIKPVAKAWAQQKEFIANASHELKTPLTVISTNTDVVLSYPDDTVKSQSKWLNYIKNETIRMSKLVNNLLCIAKYDANKINTIYSKIDLSELVSGICLQYEPLVFENNKTLITDIDDNLQIQGDEDKLKQVVNILMDNALKYSTENGSIKISLKKIKQASICMTVSNSSEEISKDKLDKIFDRFYRVESSRNRKTGGSGLGLNIAKTIIENHKGTINVINKDNITSFIVTF